MSDDGEESLSPLEALQAQHRKEMRELQNTITSMKKSVPKGDNKRKKAVAAEIEALELSTAQRHAAELAAAQTASAPQASSSYVAVDEAASTEPARPSKAQKQRVSSYCDGSSSDGHYCCASIGEEGASQARGRSEDQGRGSGKRSQCSRGEVDLHYNITQSLTRLG